MQDIRQLHSVIPTTITERASVHVQCLILIHDSSIRPSIHLNEGTSQSAECCQKTTLIFVTSVSFVMFLVPGLVFSLVMFSLVSLALPSGSSTSPVFLSPAALHQSPPSVFSLVQFIYFPGFPCFFARFSPSQIKFPTHVKSIFFSHVVPGHSQVLFNHSQVFVFSQFRLFCVLAQLRLFVVF